MSTQTKTYEVVIEETLTYIVEVHANNKGMAKIQAKALAKKMANCHDHNVAHSIAIKSCEEKELVQ